MDALRGQPHYPWAVPSSGTSPRLSGWPPSLQQSAILHRPPKEEAWGTVFPICSFPQPPFLPQKRKVSLQVQSCCSPPEHSQSLWRRQATIYGLHGHCECPFWVEYMRVLFERLVWQDILTGKTAMHILIGHCAQTNCSDKTYVLFVRIFRSDTQKGHADRREVGTFWKSNERG